MVAFILREGCTPRKAAEAKVMMEKKPAIFLRNSLKFMASSLVVMFFVLVLVGLSSGSAYAGAPPTQQLCPSLDNPGFGIADRILNCITDRVEASIDNGGLYAVQQQLSRVITVILSIFLMVQAIRFMLGADSNPKAEAIKNAILLGLAIFFLYPVNVIAAGGFDASGVAFMYGFLKTVHTDLYDISRWVLTPIATSGTLPLICANDALSSDVFGYTFCLIKSIFGIGPENNFSNFPLWEMVKGSLFIGGLGIAILVVCVLSAVLLLFALASSLHIYLTSLIALTFLSFVAPILIPMGLFKSTRNSFTIWTQMLVAYTFMPAVIILYLVFMLITMDTVISMSGGIIQRYKLHNETYYVTDGAGQALLNGDGIPIPNPNAPRPAFNLAYLIKDANKGPAPVTARNAALPGATTVSDDLLKALKRFEGAVPYAYYDGGSFCAPNLNTIGIGHLFADDCGGGCNYSCPQVRNFLRYTQNGLHMTDAEMFDLLRQDVQYFVEAMQDRITAAGGNPSALTQGQLDALVLMSYVSGPFSGRIAPIINNVASGNYAEARIQLNNMYSDQCASRAGLCIRADVAANFFFCDYMGCADVPPDDMQRLADEIGTETLPGGASTQTSVFANAVVEAARTQLAVRCYSLGGAVPFPSPNGLTPQFDCSGLINYAVGIAEASTGVTLDPPYPGGSTCVQIPSNFAPDMPGAFRASLDEVIALGLAPGDLIYTQQELPGSGQTCTGSEPPQHVVLVSDVDPGTGQITVIESTAGGSPCALPGQVMCCGPNGGVKERRFSLFLGSRSARHIKVVKQLSKIGGTAVAGGRPVAVPQDPECEPYTDPDTGVTHLSSWSGNPTDPAYAGLGYSNEELMEDPASNPPRDPNETRLKRDYTNQKCAQRDSAISLTPNPDSYDIGLQFKSANPEAGQSDILPQLLPRYKYYIDPSEEPDIESLILALSSEDLEKMLAEERAEVAKQARVIRKTSTGNIVLLNSSLAAFKASHPIVTINPTSFKSLETWLLGQSVQLQIELNGPPPSAAALAQLSQAQADLAVATDYYYALLETSNIAVIEAARQEVVRLQNLILALWETISNLPSEAQWRAGIQSKMDQVDQALADITPEMFAIDAQATAGITATKEANTELDKLNDIDTTLTIEDPETIMRRRMEAAERESLIGKQQETMGLLSLIAMFIVALLLHRTLYNVMTLGMQLAGVGGGVGIPGLKIFKMGSGMINKVTGVKT
jgi:GH24 family phage-related lysozyme (muramidase)